ncbi:MAG TPA: molybdopterin-dependent oxidoreductase [Ktedonobacteraceae bacterium]
MLTYAQYAHLTVYQEHPLNAGTPFEILRRAFLTPNDAFFIRSHGTLPVVERESYCLTVTGMVQRPLELSLAALLAHFEQRTLTATLVCAGSRRDELAAIHPLPGAVPWSADPISTARWRGVRLRDVLQAAGIGAEARYVAFRGLDEAREEGQTIPFGSSISLEKALSPEVLLTYEINDAPLTREHGFPLRVLIPGYVGARSVKWLQEITLQSQPSDNYFQDRDYKLFPPAITAETANWSQGQTLEAIALNSAICSPLAGETCRTGPINVRGYAITGQPAPIERVELSTDGGASWTPATITDRTDRWAWCLWQTTLHLPAGDHQLTVRAHDSAGHTQPKHAQPLWNFKGYANNAWHSVHFRVV